MDDWINHQNQIRLLTFLGIMLTMGFAEVVSQARSPSRTRRWPSHFGLQILNTLVLRLFFPSAAVGLSFYFWNQKIGLFHLLDLSDFFRTILTIVLLDLTIYFQHLFFHRVPLLWRIHRVHHSDLHLDFTSGIRFHPLEILISMIIKISLIGLLGLNPFGVFVFEILLSTCSIFNHANIKISKRIDRILRGLIITPSFHLIHHSQNPKETNSNFGFSVPWWDWIFRTYTQESKGLKIGLKDYSHENQNFKWLMKLPFD